MIFNKGAERLHKGKGQIPSTNAAQKTGYPRTNE